MIGRVARIDDAARARDAFAAAEALAREHDLPTSRVSALHELGTVDLLQDGSTARLERARQLAEEAGVLGKAATLDLQIAAGLLHGDPARGLEHARRCADLARRLRADRLHATAVCFQAIAHIELGDREQAERCTAQALTLAPDDLDINAAVWGQIRAHDALLADDLPRLLESLDKAEDYLRRSPSTAATPIRGLWALVRTLSGQDGDAARAEAGPWSVNWENAALLGYAEAVACGRREPAAGRPTGSWPRPTGRWPRCPGGSTGSGCWSPTPRSPTTGATRSAGPGRRCRSSPAAARPGWPAAAARCCGGPARRCPGRAAATPRCRRRCARSG